jgi:hypothetical protein
VAALILPSSCGPEDGREEGGLAAAVATVDAVDRLGGRHVRGETVLSAPDILPAINEGQFNEEVAMCYLVIFFTGWYRIVYFDYTVQASQNHTIINSI